MQIYKPWPPHLIVYPPHLHFSERSCSLLKHPLGLSVNVVGLPTENHYCVDISKDEVFVSAITRRFLFVLEWESPSAIAMICSHYLRGEFAASISDAHWKLCWFAFALLSSCVPLLLPLPNALPTVLLSSSCFLCCRSFLSLGKLQKKKKKTRKVLLENTDIACIIPSLFFKSN